MTAEMHESGIRVYKVTPGTKSPSNPAVSVARLPVVAKQSRVPFAGSEISFHLLSSGQWLLPLAVAIAGAVVATFAGLRHQLHCMLEDVLKYSAAMHIPGAEADQHLHMHSILCL